MSSNQQAMMKGLQLFIADVRNCQTKDQEEKTVYSEMAKIRSKFQSNKAMSGYDKKKYVWKLIYMHILGYDVDFGHEESLNLINAMKFSEKCTGYIATGIMLNEKSDQKLFERVINAIKSDLTCGNESCESLALATIGNIGSIELANELSEIVMRKAFSDSHAAPIFVRKRACLALLSFFKRNRSMFNQQKWAQGFKQLLSNTNYGMLMSACALIHGTISIMGRDGFNELVPILIKILSNINAHATDYYYYMTPCPWLQIKILRLLQLFAPPEEESNLTKINEILLEIVNKTEVTKNVNKNNSDHSILFEAINLIIHYKQSAFEVLRKDIVNLLGKYISVKEPNIRYLALEAMAKLKGPQLNSNLIKQHLQTILVSLRDPDISIRRRALDLMFCLCDQQMAAEVVNELLDYLSENDFELKEEMVLKIAILAEKFAENLNWYIDVIIKLIEYAGDYVSEDIWFRVAQIVTGFGEAEPNYTLQKYAALKLFDILQMPSLHETMIKIGAYVLSEFGNMIADQPGKDMQKQFELIHKHFYSISPQGRGMLLTAYMKMIRNCPSMKQTIEPIFMSFQDYWDEDIQQRACEYLAMIKRAEEYPNADQLYQFALSQMPNFSESLQTNSILTRRILKLKVDKGFAINQEEAEKHIKQGLQQFDTNVSAALSTNQPHIISGMNLDLGNDLLSMEPKITTQPKQANLLDLDMQEESKAIDILSSINDIASLLPGISDKAEVYSHKFYYAHAHKFAPQQTVKIGDTAIDMKSCFNPQQWKALLPTSMKEGVIYSDQNIEITASIQSMKFLERILLTFNSKMPGSLSDINIKLPSQYFAQYFDMQCSPVRYPPDQSPQAIVMIMLKEPIQVSPHMSMLYTTSMGETKFKIDFRLPIFLNKFTEPVDMPLDVFQKNWDDITHNRPTFQKVDVIIKNPAPPNIPHTEVLKKMENFFANCMNLKVFFNESTMDFYDVKAVGQINFKPPAQVGFPSNPNEVQKPITVPVMMEAEFFQEDLSELKISLRSSDTKIIASPLIHFLKFFINPQQ